MEKTIEDKAIRQLRISYDVIVTATAALFLLTLFHVIDLSTSGIIITHVAEQYALMITLISIPVALKLFANKLKKFSEKTDKLLAIKTYKSAYYTRLGIITVVTLGNIFLFAISRNSNFMWFTIVMFIIYFFCRPSYPELISLTETKNTEKNDEQTA